MSYSVASFPLQEIFYPLAGVFLYLGLLVLLAEIVSRFMADDPELTRKVVHIGSGNVILLAWWLEISRTVIVWAAVIAAAIAITSYVIPILPSIESVGRRSFGTLFYAMSIGLLTGYFWQDQPQYAVIGILIMAWGDGLAAIVGQRWGKHQYQIGQINKSWEGSLAMATSAVMVILPILLFTEGSSWQIWILAVGVAMLSAIAEAFSQWGLDNLTVPLTGGILCFLGVQVLL